MERLPELLRYAEQDSRDWASARPGICAFVAYGRERLNGLRCEDASLIVVLEGWKELVCRGWSQTFRPGQAFLIPPGWEGDVINNPADRTGAYRALMLSFPMPLVCRAMRAHPSLAASSGSADASRTGFGVKLDSALEDALLHAASSTRRQLSKPVVEHRVMEVLIQLVEQRVWWLQPASADVVGQLRRVIRVDPGRSWSMTAVARSIGCSPATLRRQLSAQNTSFRATLQSERMQAAKLLLSEPGSRLVDVAAQCGYKSPHKFSRRYRAVTGESPVAA